MTLAAILLLISGAITVEPTPVIVSTDVGCEMDDQWAITHMMLSPAFDVRAIVTSHTPYFEKPAAESSAKVARTLIDQIKPPKRPVVVPGASEPLVDRMTPRKNAGVETILKESSNFHRDKRLTIVHIGPATDIASALLIDPTIADRITVVAMAFEGWPAGGDPFNVKNDDAAWQILLDSKVPLTVVDCAVSLKHLLMSLAQAKQRFAELGPRAEALLGYQTAWLDGNPSLVKLKTGDPNAWPLWDCGTVAVLLGLAKTETHPRPTLRDDRSFDHTNSVGTIEWVKSIDGDSLWADLVNRIKTAP
jgi:inosine-uridine nucleoside N-ribohydrolase